MQRVPRRTRDIELTPPRNLKRTDKRNSAERGIRKQREEDYRTPIKISSVDSKNGAPLRARRPRFRMELFQDDEGTNETEMTDTDLLSNWLTYCVNFE